MTRKEIIEALALPEGTSSPGRVAFQPLLSAGWKYHEPTSGSDETYWLRTGCGPNCCDGARHRHTTEKVARSLGVDTGTISRWEMAANAAAESGTCQRE